MHCSSPARIAWAASITALSPDPHTLLMVSAGTVPGRPAWIAACRPGAWPTPPWSTFPMITSSTAPSSIPARRTASRITSAPSLGAGNGASPPRYLPIGVRTAETMTGVVLSGIFSNERDQAPGANLVLQLRHEISDGQHRLLVPCSPSPHRDRARLGLALPHHRHVGDFLQLAVADPVVEGLVALVEMRANARRAQPLV